VAGLGALQAQVPRAPFWALQARLADFDPTGLTAALQDGRLLRSSLIRGTLHVAERGSHAGYATVAADTLAGMWRRLLADAPVTPAEVQAVVRAVCAERPLRRDDLVAAVTGWLADQPGGAGFVDALVGAHHGHLLRAHPWLVCRPVSGDWQRRGEWLYSPAPSVRANRPPMVDPQAALAELIVVQLRAAGPCALADLRAWTGETRVRRLQAALRQLGERVRCYRGVDGDRLYDLDGEPLPAPADLDRPIRFLGEFDSALISYAPANRHRLLPPEFADAVLNRANGQWRPSLLVDGRVAGTWRFAVSGAAGPATVTITALRHLPVTQRRRVRAAAEELIATAEPGRDPRVEFVG